MTRRSERPRPSHEPTPDLALTVDRSGLIIKAR